MIFIGLDVGTTKVAAAVIDTTARRVRRCAGREHRAEMAGGKGWEHLQEPRFILSVAKELLAESAQDCPAVDGICVTGQMHGVLYLDGGGNPLSPLFTWLDGRGGLAHPDGGTYAEALSRRTGYRLSPGFGSVTHFYNLTQGLVPPGASVLCTIMDYVAMHLCRSPRPVSDATTAASIGLFDLEALCFDAEALEHAGMAGIGLPEVAAAGTLLGTTGDGIPVYAPIADNQASFLGAVRDAEGSVLVNVGTGGQVSLYAPSSRSQAAEVEVRPFPGGGYLHVGAALCSGKAYEQLRTFFRQVLRVFGADERAADYPAMNALAANAGAGGSLLEALTVDTRFAGTRVDPAIRGSIAAIGLENLTPENLVRGYIEGIAEELYAFYARMISEGARPLAHLIGSGNGLRANPVLRAALEGRFGRSFELPREREEAALGAALCAAVGAGQYRDYRSAGELIAYEE